MAAVWRSIPAYSPLTKSQMRIQIAQATELYIRNGGVITACPPETTTEKLNRLPRGAKLQHDWKLSATERSAKRYLINKLNALAAELPEHERFVFSWKFGVQRHRRAEPHEWSLTVMERAKTIAPIGEDAMREHHGQGTGGRYVISSHPRALEQWADLPG